MSEYSPEGGRRVAAVSSRRAQVTTAVAVALVSLTLALLATVRPWQPPQVTEGPQAAGLERVDLGCPAALGDAGIAIASADGTESGDLEVTDFAGGRSEPSTVALQGAALAEVTPSGPAVVTGRAAVAVGLVAARFGGSRPAVGACAAPVADQWFTGVGARPRHASIVALTNPDRGPAVADLLFLGGRGPLDVDATRGIRVPGRTTRLVDLAATLPTRTELTMQVLVSRGRLSATVTDRVREIGEPVSTEWLTAQAAPTESGELLGLPTARGRHTLIVANPGSDEARVQVQLVTPSSVFAPAGVDEISVPPGATQTVTLDTVLQGRSAKDALGLRLDSTQPVTATLRSVAGADTSLSVLTPGIEGEFIALSPGVTGRGSQSLVVSGAQRTGTLTVVSRGADGKQLSRDRIDVAPERGFVVRLPKAARVVTVLAERTAISGVLTVAIPGGTGGHAVAALQPVVRTALIPAVRPVLP